MSLTFDIFHFDISGNDSKEEHLQNILEISLAFDIFHFDISGNNFNDEHLQNKMTYFLHYLHPN